MNKFTTTLRKIKHHRLCKPGLADYLDAHRNEAVASLAQIAPEVFGGEA